MSDHISVTSHHSYGSRVGNSFKWIFWWIILVIASIVLLVWNEKNFLEQKKALEEWAAVVQEAVVNQIDPSLEWKEIHVSWETASDAEALTDSEFWVTTNDLKLKRTVEMYQWYEESEEHCTDNYWGSEDCTTTYDYYKKWSDSAINSSSFYSAAGHENPSTWEFQSNEQEKYPITLWAYTLTHTFTSQLTNYNTINLSEQNIQTPSNYAWDNSSKFHISSNYIYVWRDPISPAVWDLRISFSSVKPGTVSIVWKQSWSELMSYTVSNWRGIALLQQWTVSAEDMFIAAQKENRMMTWFLRLFWLILMFAGFSAMFKFIETIAKVLPFLANIVGAWTSIIALGLTLIVGFVTIGLAWLAVRPIIGISCLVVAVAGILLLRRWKKDKKPEAAEGMQNPQPVEAPEAIKIDQPGEEVKN